MDLARISGVKVEELKNFLQLLGLRTYEEVDLSTQNALQSPKCAVHRSGVLWWQNMQYVRLMVMSIILDRIRLSGLFPNQLTL